MSDNAKVFRAIKNKLTKLYPGQPRGNLARRLNTLAGFVSGIVSSKSVNLPKVAEKVPAGKKPTSQEKQFSRWIQNQYVDFEHYFLPFVEIMLRNMTGETLIFAIDGSVVGRGCIVLMVSVIFQGRSLPVTWLVVKAKKGHLEESFHMEVLNSLQEIVPDGKDVVILGDGEFDGTGIQQDVNNYGWHYVLRTGKNITVVWQDYQFALREALLCINSGEYMMFRDVLFTKEKYGPVHVICYWREGCKDPIFLVTNFDSAGKACVLYELRFRIETFFSDQKSRGFNIHKSHLSDPDRIARLLIAACLAYIWIIYLGVVAKRDGWVKIIHRTERCDLSLFQLGLRLLTYILNEGIEIPISFAV